ncbi:MAG: MgtC/SapB family protein [Candidatus Micrarchaeia archaeon]
MEILNFLVKVVLSSALGAIIGSEREVSLKQRVIGLRSFSLISLFGTLLVLFSFVQLPLSEVYPAIGLIGIFAYVFLSYKSIRLKFGLSTLLCIPLSYLVGVLVGFGYYSLAASLTFIVVVILVVGEHLHKYIESLKREEIDQIVQFALILFVIFPLLPEQPYLIGKIQLDLKLFFEIILLISLFNLFAFLCARFFKKKDAVQTGFLYGVINSTAAIYLFANRDVEEKGKNNYEGAVFSSILGSTVRNFALAIILFHSLISQQMFIFFLSLIFITILLILFGRKKIKVEAPIYVPFNIASGITIAFAIFSASILFQILSIQFEFLVPLASLIGSTISSALVIASLSTLYLSQEIVLHALILTIAGSLVADTIVIALANPHFSSSYYKKVSILFLVCIIFYFFV